MKSVSLLIAFLMLSVCYAQPVSQVFNSSGTWVIPAGYTANIFIEAWGGGGGGGAQTPKAKGGGGGGAYANATFSNVPSGSYDVTVGTGGTPGNPGGFSSFNYLGGVVAAGGNSTVDEFGGAGGLLSMCIGELIVAGSNGNNASGNNGGDGGDGASGGGEGGAGGLANNGDGGDGDSVGGGGGGKAGPGNGGNSGNGGNGKVIITVFALNPLPVELAYFKGAASKNTVELYWQTASESYNEKFIVERSVDGKAYQAIGVVAGAGTTQEQQRYIFIDEQPLTGLNYYRLKQIDFDGKFEYSPVIAVDFRASTGILVYPTLVRDAFQIELPEDATEKTTLHIYSMLGSLVYSQELVGDGTLSVNLPPFANGQYLVEIVNGANRKLTRVFKQ